jgi:hypothetical protein
MQIALDLDGVVMNSIQALIDTFKLDITHSQITCYNFEEIERLHLTKKNVVEMFEDLDWTKVELYPNTIVGIGLLLSKHHDLYFLTNKTPKMLTWTKKVLKLYHLDKFSMIVDAKKHEHAFNILVEDKGETAQICAKFNKKCVLIDRPWNRGYDFPRYKDLLDFAQHI